VSCLPNIQFFLTPNRGLKLSTRVTSLFLAATAPQWVRASSFTRFLDHIQRRTTVGRTPPDEWSARRRDLYLTTHNTYNRRKSMPPVGFEPTISAGERPQTHALDREATGTGERMSCRPTNVVLYLKMLRKHSDFYINYWSAYIGSLLHLTAILCTFLSRVSYQRWPLSLPYKISKRH